MRWFLRHVAQKTSLDGSDAGLARLGFESDLMDAAVASRGGSVISPFCRRVRVCQIIPDWISYSDLRRQRSYLV